MFPSIPEVLIDTNIEEGVILIRPLPDCLRMKWNRIDIATLFPEMCERVLSESIIGRARLSGAVDIFCHDIRTFTENKHRRVDDKPYGGGTGMVMAAQPIHDCIISIMTQINPASPRLIYLSPQGKPLTQNLVKELSKESNLILLCGHYEGVDQHVLDALSLRKSPSRLCCDRGELPALVLTDAVVRLQEGVLPDEEAYTIESHYNGLLGSAVYPP